MSQSPIHEARKQPAQGAMKRSERLAAEAGLVALIGFAFGLIAPFGTDQMPMGSRMVLWILGFLLGWLLVYALTKLASHTARLLGLAPLWAYATSLPLSAVIITGAIVALRPELNEQAQDGFAFLLPQILFLAGAFFLLFYLIYSRAEKRSEAASANLASGDELTHTKGMVGAPNTKLHEQLKAGFPAIIALSVEDHYTVVHAETAREMILLPLGEAIGLLPQDQGLQTHRSWWVARGAVKRASQVKRNWQLELINGLEVPIARNRVAELKESGWLEG